MDWLNAWAQLMEQNTHGTEAVLRSPALADAVAVLQAIGDVWEGRSVSITTYQ